MSEADQDMMVIELYPEFGAYSIEHSGSQLHRAYSISESTAISLLGNRRAAPELSSRVAPRTAFVAAIRCYVLFDSDLCPAIPTLR